jgi:phosphohistidine phosphatase
MKLLIIVRHAKSSWKEPSLADFDRPLNKRGKADAPEMGRRLAARGVRPDLVVSSPARRARKTAQAVVKELGLDKDGIVEEGAIYEAGLSTLAALTRGLDDKSEQVVLVGHNPGLTELAEYLSGEMFGNIPTGGAVGLEFDVDSWSDLKRGAGQVLFADFPKDARGG